MTTKTTVTDKSPAEDLMEAFGLLVWHIVKAVAVIAWWALLFPMISVPLGGAVAAGVLLGWPYGFALVGVFIAGMVAWRLRSPRTFERWITGRARTRFLAWRRYRLGWSGRLTACKLTVAHGTGLLVPRRVSVAVGAAVDVVRVRMLQGQCPADWESRADNLAHTFGATDCRVRIAGPGLVELRFRRADALADPFELPPIDGGRFCKETI
ncbi:hypothetical protein F5X71_00095 [Nocardia brasiliensis]|uniref:Uncharacterized protein n=1 Tax=Nocardia brasiliensis TaxID=37326 RepID=A0A6G9XJB7_NOCBR|nr:hypothetical protein [Nocardia brasiliensis]QIS00940.1 hypothetical protein F5X71_00095 [Nocardia brasiliensis]